MKNKKVMVSVKAATAIIMASAIMTMASPAVHAETTGTDQGVSVQCEAVSEEADTPEENTESVDGDKVLQSENAQNEDIQSEDARNEDIQNEDTGTVDPEADAQTDASAEETAGNTAEAKIPEVGEGQDYGPQVAFNQNDYPEYADSETPPGVIATCYEIGQEVNKYQLNKGDIVFAYNEKAGKGDIIRITDRYEYEHFWGLYSETTICYTSVMDDQKENFNTANYSIRYYRLKMTSNVTEPALIDTGKLTGNLLYHCHVNSFGFGTEDTVYDYSKVKKFLNYARILREQVKTGQVSRYLLGE